MAETKTFTVTGMTCDNCVQHVTKAIKEVAGVTAVEVSLEKKSAKVEGQFDDAKVVEAVVEEGYERPSHKRLDGRPFYRNRNQQQHIDIFTGVLT